MERPYISGIGKNMVEKYTNWLAAIVALSDGDFVDRITGHGNIVSFGNPSIEGNRIFTPVTYEDGAKSIAWYRPSDHGVN